ncbi:MAG TPA: hypothetical protein VEV38_11040, partial [Candidatus Eremiobacteraceae bacterium]|nr:hypothetical protein [Candidatus Eremiobacteraceae bacterium]
IALRLDSSSSGEGQFTSSSTASTLEYSLERLQWYGHDTALSEHDSAAFSKSSLTALGTLSATFTSTIVADSWPGITPAYVRWMTPDSLRHFQLEFAWIPYPLARVAVVENGDDATVTRTLELGPLANSGQRESWHRNAAGNWTLSAILARWKF